MAKFSFGAYPHMLGFEQLEQLLERTAKSSNEGYPPFNIEQTSDRSFRISLATAGFSEADLTITLDNRQLVIQGKKNQETGTRIFLHRGIATRQFQRSFVLADGVEVVRHLWKMGYFTLTWFKIFQLMLFKRLK